MASNFAVEVEYKRLVFARRTSFQAVAEAERLHAEIAHLKSADAFDVMNMIEKNVNAFDSCTV